MKGCLLAAMLLALIGIGALVVGGIAVAALFTQRPLQDLRKSCGTPSIRPPVASMKARAASGVMYCGFSSSGGL